MERRSGFRLSSILYMANILHIAARFSNIPPYRIIVFLLSPDKLYSSVSNLILWFWIALQLENFPTTISIHSTILWLR